MQIGSCVPVGVWKCKVESGLKRTHNVTTKVFINKLPIYILFNPYSRGKKREGRIKDGCHCYLSSKCKFLLLR